jgi:hypothetical protein
MTDETTQAGPDDARVGPEDDTEGHRLAQVSPDELRQAVPGPDDLRQAVPGPDEIK